MADLASSPAKFIHAISSVVSVVSVFHAFHFLPDSP